MANTFHDELTGADLHNNKVYPATNSELSSWNPTDTRYTRQTRTISTLAPLVGGGSLGADLALSLPAATGSQSGYLSSADWTTFNTKGFTTAIVVGPNGSSGNDYTCNGTSDQIQIQAAINAANTAGGGIVRLKAGIYILSGRVSLFSINNVRIVGAGMNLTILKNYGIIKNDATLTSNISIEDLTIDNTATSNEQCINLLSNSYDFCIRRVFLKNATNRFLLHWSGVDRLLVEGCIFYDGGLGTAADNAAGAQLTTTRHTTVFRNNWFIKQSSLGGGLLTTGSTGNLLIQGNNLVESQGVCKSRGR